MLPSLLLPIRHKTRGKIEQNLDFFSKKMTTSPDPEVDVHIYVFFMSRIRGVFLRLCDRGLSYSKHCHIRMCTTDKGNNDVLEYV